MIEFDNQTDSVIDIGICQDIASYLSDRDIELVAVCSKDMQELNKTYRDIDKPTDVLSFPLEELPDTPIGSIVINIDKVNEVSENLSHSFDEEFALMFLHGLLHLLGYDHENDNGEMREKEKEIIEHFSLPKSLIIRSE